MPSNLSRFARADIKVMVVRGTRDEECALGAPREKRPIQPQENRSLVPACVGLENPGEVPIYGGVYRAEREYGCDRG